MGIVAIGIGKIDGITLHAKERDQNGCSLGYDVISSRYGIIFGALSIEEW